MTAAAMSWGDLGYSLVVLSGLALILIGFGVIVRRWFPPRQER